MSAAETPGDGPSGWTELFWAAFRGSRNAMALVDTERRFVEVNGALLRQVGYRRGDLVGRPIWEHVVGGPIQSTSEWRATISKDQFTGVADMILADGGRLTVEWAGHPATVTGSKLILFVALRTSRRNRQSVDRPPEAEPIQPLTYRELEVTRLIAMGATGPEVADELQLAHNTVRTHVRNAMAKLGAHSRAQLVAKALGEGLL